MSNMRLFVAAMLAMSNQSIAITEPQPNTVRILGRQKGDSSNAAEKKRNRKNAKRLANMNKGNKS